MSKFQKCVKHVLKEFARKGAGKPNEFAVITSPSSRGHCSVCGVVIYEGMLVVDGTVPGVVSIGICPFCISEIGKVAKRFAEKMPPELKETRKSQQIAKMF